MSGIFTPKTISFLRAIKRNNNKVWFEKHREEYVEHLKDPCQVLIAALDEPLRKGFPGIEVTKRSVTRIHRDTRFSSDKSPYKDWVGFNFRDRTVPNKMGPHLYFGFDKTGFGVGAGIYGFEGLQRAHFRDCVVSEKQGREFQKIAASMRRVGFEVGGKSLKKIPVGYDPKHANAEFLLHNGCYLWRETDLLKIFYSPKFPEWIVKAMLPTRPFYEWMREMARTAPKDPRTFFHVDESRTSGRDEFTEAEIY